MHDVLVKLCRVVGRVRARVRACCVRVARVRRMVALPVFDLLGRFLDALKPIVGQGERTRELLRPLADAGQVNKSGLGARSTPADVRTDDTRSGVR